MRIENSIKNIKYSSVFFVINILLQFVIKSVLIFYIGIEYSGLNSVLKNLLEFLNITELGISTSVTYSLYKPIREKNYDKINSIIVFYKKMYIIIGMIIALISGILLLFINNIVNSNEISYFQISVYFISYSFMAVCSYFFTYMQTLVIANQKNYIIVKINGILNFVKILVQILATILFRSFFIFIFIEILVNIFGYVYINIKFRKEYSYLDLKNTKSFKELLCENVEVFNNTKNLVVHKLCAVILFQTDNIILSMFTNLVTVAMYNNYYFITSACYRFIIQVLSSISSSVGDLVAEGDDKKSFTIWRELYLLTTFVGVVTCFCLYINIDDFIILWLGEDFLLSNIIIIVLLISLYISIIRSPIDIFKEGYGIFYDRWAAVTETIINLVTSLYLVNKLGMIGVIIGTILSNVIIVLLWKPYLVFKCGFKMSVKEYFKIAIVQIIIGLVSVGLSYYIISNFRFCLENNIVNFVVNSLFSLVTITSIYLFLSMFYSQNRKLYAKYINKLFKFKISRKN